MGRSAFEGVSDGEWSVFAEKVVKERDEALVEVSKLQAEAAQHEKQLESADETWK